MRATALFLDRISAFLDRLALYGAVFSVALLVLVAGWQVVARYVLSQPPAWTEELARFMMVWAGLLGASVAYRAMADPCLFPGARDRQDETGRVFAVIRTLGTIAFVTPILWYSLFSLRGQVSGGYIARNARQMAETMDVPMSVFAIAVPLGFTLILIHALALGAMTVTRPAD